MAALRVITSGDVAGGTSAASNSILFQSVTTSARATDTELPASAISTTQKNLSIFFIMFPFSSGESHLGLLWWMVKGDEESKLQSSPIAGTRPTLPHVMRLFARFPLLFFLKMLFVC
jgi:hypothetical protein